MRSKLSDVITIAGDGRGVSVVCSLVPRPSADRFQYVIRTGSDPHWVCVYNLCVQYVCVCVCLPCVHHVFVHAISFISHKKGTR